MRGVFVSLIMATLWLVQQVVAGVKLAPLIALLVKAGSFVTTGLVFKYTHRR